MAKEHYLSVEELKKRNARIRELREKQNLTTPQIAIRFGLSPSYIANLLRNDD